MPAATSRQKKSESSSSTPSSASADSNPSPENSASASGASLKSSLVPVRSESDSPKLSDSSATPSALSLIAQSLDIQDSLRMSQEDRETDARAKSYAMTWGNPLWIAARKRQADMGKEPQWLSDRGAGFDRKVEAPPAPISIRIQQVFADGERKERIVTVGPEERS